jgi:16S rRNA (uracil1498-N3)-methyltransferase
VVERADRAPVGTFYAPGAWSSVVELDEAAAHHVQVKRLREGDPVRLTSGDGRRAAGTLEGITKRHAAVRLDTGSVEHVPAAPAVELHAPVGDRDRMLLLAEKSVELGLSAWYPVVYARSRSVSPRGEGEQFREKLRLRMVSALEQSGGAWLPEIHVERPADVLYAPAGGCRILLDGAGPPFPSLASALTAPCAIALGPEGGLAPDERDALLAAGWRPVSLSANVLRFETAGIAALALVRTHLA